MVMPLTRCKAESYFDHETFLACTMQQIWKLDTINHNVSKRTFSNYIDLTFFLVYLAAGVLKNCKIRWLFYRQSKYKM